MRRVLLSASAALVLSACAGGVSPLRVAPDQGRRPTATTTTLVVDPCEGGTPASATPGPAITEDEVNVEDFAPGEVVDNYDPDWQDTHDPAWCGEG